MKGETIKAIQRGSVRFLGVILFASALLVSLTTTALADPVACGEEPVCMVLMLDRTGSVSVTNRDGETDAVVGTKIDTPPAGLGIEDLGMLGILAAADSGHLISVGRFGDGANGGLEAEILPSLRLRDVNANLATMRGDVIAMMNSSSSVGTNLTDVVTVAQNELQSGRCGGVTNKVMVILSDGDPTEPSNPDTSANNAATTAKNLGIRIVTIAFDASGASGDDEANRALLAGMASPVSTDPLVPSTDNFCMSDHCNAVDQHDENNDNDFYFIATTGSDVGLVLSKVLEQATCPACGSCHQADCNEETNQCGCVLVEDCTSCERDSDCDLCNGESCGEDGTCQPGTPLICSDQNPCTDDSCDPHTGCVFPLNADPCDDGDDCTENDVCSGGQCGGAQKNCADESECTQDSCNADGQCVHDTSQCECDEASDCDDGNACTDDGCFNSTCVHTPDDGKECSDSNACTTNDSCRDGVCAGGAPLICDDRNSCTADACAAESGCTHDPVSQGGTTCGLGICQKTIDDCRDGESQTCTPGDPNPAGEICGNDLDDDCNGVVDEEGCTELASCITINTPPELSDDTADNRTNQPIEIHVLDNDADADGPGSLEIRSVTALDGGSATVSPDKKSIIYTPDPKANEGSADFNNLVYEVSDGDACNGVRTAKVEVRNLGVAGGFCSLIR